jgi:uridine phosphorylase
MSLGEKLTNKIFKWVVLYPRFRKFLNWAYSDVMKMPQYHIGMAPGQIGEYVLLVDDPLDAHRAANLLEGAQEIAWHREYRTFTGTLNGTKVSVTSIGIGGPSAAIGVHELATIGAQVFLYLGCGLAASKGVKAGDLVIAKGVVRDEGTGLQYAPLAFPAIADLRMVDCLRQACRDGKHTHHTGLTRSTDTYYNISKDEAMAFPHTLCSDLNSAAIFVTASVLKKRAGALLQARERIGPLSDTHIAAGMVALRRLITLDVTK